MRVVDDTCRAVVDSRFRRLEKTRSTVLIHSWYANRSIGVNQTCNHLSGTLVLDTGTRM